MKHIRIILLLALISFNCKKKSAGQDGSPVSQPTIGATVSSSVYVAVTTSTAQLSNIIFTDNGGVTISARGVCWGTIADPVITGNHSSDGSGTASFVSTITGLAPVSSYHARAYISNSVGTVYGNDVSFTTNP